MMNHEDLMRTLAAAEALAEACRKQLTDESLRVFKKHRSAMGERFLGIGTLSTSLSKPGAVVTDPDKFTKWVSARYPTEVETIVKIRNQAWVKRLLPTLAPIPQDGVTKGLACCDGEGTVAEGVLWFPGGEYLHASVKLHEALKDKFAVDAASYLRDGKPMAALAPAALRAIEGTATVSDQP